MARQTAADRYRPHRFRENPREAGNCLDCPLIKANAIHLDHDLPDPAALRAGDRPDQEEE